MNSYELGLGLGRAIWNRKMTAASSILDFSHEDTSDFSGVILLKSVLGSTPPPIPFRAHVPPHLPEDAIQHWDFDLLQD